MWYTLNDDLEPVPCDDMLTAAKWFEVAKNREVVVTEIGEDCFLSTVFLGLDHNYLGDKPILYESLWFGGKHDGDQRRYSTRDEALEGHKEMLAEAGYSCVVLDAKKPWKVGLVSLLTKEQHES